MFGNNNKISEHILIMYLNSIDRGSIKGISKVKIEHTIRIESHFKLESIRNKYCKHLIRHDLGKLTYIYVFSMEPLLRDAYKWYVNGG